MAIEASFVHCWGHLSWNSSVKIAELTTSWFSVLWTVRIDSIVDHGGFPLWGETKWSLSSLCTLAVYYIVSWPSFTLIWIYSHLIACCLFLLLPVLRMIFKCASCVSMLVAALVALRWTNWCLRSCCLPESDIWGVTPIDLPGLLLFWHDWDVCEAMMC